jgi:hypothetical protein
VVVTAEIAAPAAPDAVVAEEDTFLVLSADPEIREPGLPRLRVFHEAFTAGEVEPGTVVVREGAPITLLAVVHRLSETPSWRAQWVGEALAGVLREAQARAIHTMTMPVLGRVHGELPVETFVLLLRGALAQHAAGALGHLWLITAAGELDEVRTLLASNLFR